MTEKKGAFVALFFLFTELDGFFKGEENNFLMTWYYTVQLIISELDVMFAKLKYNLFMFKQSPVEFFRPKSDKILSTAKRKSLENRPNTLGRRETKEEIS